MEGGVCGVAESWIWKGRCEQEQKVCTFDNASHLASSVARSRQRTYSYTLGPPVHLQQTR